MSDVSVLTAGGILRAADVVSIANAVGLELAAAATLLIKESSGGQNIWGRDPVRVAPNTYVKGGPVTQANYNAYIAAVRAGRAGRQGCGPTQLTSAGFQQRADDLGGTWRFEVNCQVGFGILADHIRTLGVEAGFAAYNGSGPAARAYGRDAKIRYDGFRARLEEDGDMPSADEIAAAVWNHAIVNGFGDTVAAQQILVATEKRVAAVQQALGALSTQVTQLQANGVSPNVIRQAVEDALDARG